MLYVVILDGPSAQKASPVVATRDPQIVQAVADAIVARLHPRLLVNLIKREDSDPDPSRVSGPNEDI
jgi:hypothetical protein